MYLSITQYALIYIVSDRMKIELGMYYENVSLKIRSKLYVN